MATTLLKSTLFSSLSRAQEGDGFRINTQKDSQKKSTGTNEKRLSGQLRGNERKNNNNVQNRSLRDSPSSGERTVKMKKIEREEPLET